MSTSLKAIVITLVTLAAAPAAAQTRPAGLCAAMPRAAAEAALKLRTFGADTLDDRLGPYRRKICSMQTDPSETLELTVWSRRDRRPFAPLTARAEACDVGCLPAGREPNLYRYAQRRIGAALCVLRMPRTDRDLAIGPITACTTGRARRIMLSIARKRGLAPAPMETVKMLLDRAARVVQ